MSEPPPLIPSVQPPSNLTFSRGLTSYFGEAKIDNKNGFLSAGNLQFTSNSTISCYALNINKQGNISAITIDNLGSITTNGTIYAKDINISNNKALIHEDGYFQSSFFDYIVPNELRNNDATTEDFIPTSTSNYLTTQFYVDKGLWYLQKQINTIMDAY